MIMRNKMIGYEKKVFTEMLYDKKAVLAWDFTAIRKVKREVASFQKIWSIEHKSWQVPGF